MASVLDGSADGPFACIWDATQDPPAMLQRMDFPIQEGVSNRYIVALAFSPCGQRLVVVTGDNRHTVSMYNWQSKELLFQGTGHNGQPPQVMKLVCDASDSEGYRAQMQGRL